MKNQRLKYFLFLLALLFVGPVNNIAFATPSESQDSGSVTTRSSQRILESLPALPNWEVLPDTLSVDILGKNIENSINLANGGIPRNNKIYSNSDTYIPCEGGPCKLLWTDQEKALAKKGFDARERKKKEENSSYNPRTMEEYLRYLNALSWKSKNENSGKLQPSSPSDAIRLPPYCSLAHRPTTKRKPLSHIKNPQAFFPIQPELPPNQIRTFHYDLLISLRRLKKHLYEKIQCREILTQPTSDFEAYQKECGHNETYVNSAKNIGSPTSWVQWAHASFDPGLIKQNATKLCRKGSEGCLSADTLEAKVLRLNHQKAKISGQYHDSRVQVVKKLETVTDEERTILINHKNRLRNSCNQTEKRTADHFIPNNDPELNNFGRWLQLMGSVKKELMEACDRKGIYQIPCVLITDPTDSPWVDSTYLWDPVLIEGFAERWADSQYLKSIKAKKDGDCYVAKIIKELPSLIKKYNEQYVNYRTENQNVRQVVEYWRKKNLLEKFFFEDVVSPSTKKVGSGICTLKTCKLEDRWLSELPQTNWIIHGKQEEWNKRSADIFPSSLEHVHTVDLSDNKLKGQYQIGDKVEILRLPMNLQCLTKLTLNQNQITQTGFLEMFENLEELHLQQNQIVKMSIPHTWTKLKVLDVSHNQLVSLLFQNLPDKSQPDISSSGLFASLVGLGSQKPVKSQPYSALTMLKLSNNPFDSKKKDFFDDGNFHLLSPKTFVQLDSSEPREWETLLGLLKSSSNPPVEESNPPVEDKGTGS